MTYQDRTNGRDGADSLRDLAVTAIFIALTYVFTWLINIRLPLPGSGGLIHLGSVPLFLAALLFGRKTGALAGGIGMGLFDLTSGWTAWAPFTFVIVGLMGYVVGLFAQKHPFQSDPANVVAAILAALAIKVGGYYLAEVILTGNFLSPIGSIPGNVLQIAFAAAIILAVYPACRRAAARIFPVRRAT
ncbi:MAG: ECF transporter S component [Lachnospiraceae bacterium]|jgi:uncharacterized membrane protein|nr:ECF transporter S component [Lachnospiraceae bacterium]MCI1397403.1 ECF transporter S component [Lachnospiraceae bacterium]MCI1423398.1 ECF transporter S component [Lachnospiraceae bacterium]MCI1452185.1 ECF transporter S component [Lachnospiraceae bacterium]